MFELTKMDSIRIGLASPEQIRQWSHGEVLKAETMLGCGYNVYYAFLVKCKRFVTRFGKPMFTPMLETV